MFNTVRMFESKKTGSHIITAHTDEDTNERLQLQVYRHNNELLVNVIAEADAQRAGVVAIPVEALEAAIAAAKNIK